MPTSNNMVRHYLQVVSLSIVIATMLVVCRSAVMSKALTSVGMLALARYLQASSQTADSSLLPRAEHLFREATRWRRADATAHRGLGLVLAAEGREDEAVVAWQAAGGMLEELIQRGEQARRAESYEEALKWYGRAIAMNPGLGDPWYYTGLAYEGLNQWEQAIEAYRRALDLRAFEYAGRSSPYYRLGWIHQRELDSPQLDKALAAYNAAIALGDFATDTEAAGAYHSRGAIYDRQGRDPLDSVREYRQALALSPQHKWARLRLGQALYRKHGNVSLAEQEIEQALTLWPDIKSRKWPYRFLGDIYRDAGLVEKAVAAYQEALRVDPNDQQVQRVLNELTGSADE